MSYAYFSHNGQVLPLARAVVPLDNIEYAYGFGVYETVRVVGGTAQFVGEHGARLLRSAEVIGLAHTFTADFVQKSIVALIEANAAAACNLKIMLIGGANSGSDGNGGAHADASGDAQLYILCLNPLFPDRQLYRDGVHCVTAHYERPFPQAKTLNMLPSYIAYRDARAADAYDALLVNRHGCVTEGTRTNLLAIRGRTLFTPPAADLLPGVMRGALLGVARRAGFQVVEQPLPLADLTATPDLDSAPDPDLAAYDGAFLTSTSSKIMPIRSIDAHVWPAIPPALRELMQAFDQFLKTV